VTASRTRIQTTEQLPKAAEELYVAPLEEFTPTRNALVKALREAGDGKAAETVAKLRKPSVSAWLVNQLVHHEGKTMSRFFAAADELRRAEEGAVSGKGAGPLRTALARQREATEAALNAARRIGGGFSAQTFDRVRETLEAAIGDPQARAAVESGRLARELRPGGAIPVAPAGRGTASKAAGKRDTKAAGLRAKVHELREALVDAESEEEQRTAAKEEAEERLRAARGGLTDTRARIRKLRSELRSAQKRL
jgi:hypothetical protein